MSKTPNNHSQVRPGGIFVCAFLPGAPLPLPGLVGAGSLLRCVCCPKAMITLLGCALLVSGNLLIASNTYQRKRLTTSYQQSVCSSARGSFTNLFGTKATCQTCLSCLTVAMSTGSRNDIGMDS